MADGKQATRSVPVSSSRSSSSRARVVSLVACIVSAASTSTSAASVSTTPRPAGSNSVRPTSSSSLPICWLTAEGV